MRAVLSTVGSTGDVQPLLALAIELRRAGHEVAVAIPPAYSERAHQLGLEFVPVGPVVSPDQLRGIMAAQMRSTKPTEQVRQFLEVSLRSLPESYKALLDACSNADVLIGAPFQFACRMVHEQTGIPFVSLHLSPFGDSGNREIMDLGATMVNPYRTKLGLPPLKDPLGADGNSEELAVYAVSEHLFQRPKQWPNHFRTVGFFFLDEEAWEPEERLKSFVVNQEKPIAITFGSMMHPDPAAMTSMILNAVATAGCRAVIQIGWTGLGASAESSSVLVTGFCPHSWLFPQSSLVVHHGGAGTTAAALRAGVPTVVIPHMLDQPVWGELSRANGCSRSVIPIAQLTANRLAAAIRLSLAAPQLQSAARVFGEKIRCENGVSAARTLIEDLVERHHRAEIRPQRILPPAGQHLAGEALPLSYGQERLWFLDQFEPASIAYNMPFAWVLKGPIDKAALQQSFTDLAMRHAVLRSSFPAEKGVPIQQVSAEAGIFLQEHVIDEGTAEERDAVLVDQMKQEFHRPFRLGSGPLLRVHLTRRSPSDHVLFGSIHHIVCDGWSIEIMLRELSRMYTARVSGGQVSLPALPMQYADFAKWQRKWLSHDILSSHLEYWKRQLKDAPVLDLLTDFVRPPVLGQRGAVTELRIDAAVLGSLKRLCREEGVTLFMILLAAFKVLLSRYSGQTDITVGSVIANRVRPEVQNLIGLFVNTLPLRTDLSGNPSFRQLLHRVQAVALDAYLHQDLPFERLVEELQPTRSLDRTPLFQVAFVLQNQQHAEFNLQTVTIEYFPLMAVVEDMPAKFDMVLNLDATDEDLVGSVEFNPELFMRESIAGFIDQFAILLTEIVHNPDQHLNGISLLAPGERGIPAPLLVRHPSTVPTGDLCEQISTHAKERASAIAFVSGSSQLTFSELENRICYVASKLYNLAVRRGTKVGLILTDPTLTIVASAALFKLGAIAVPVGQENPRTHIQFLLKSFEIHAVLCTDATLEKVTESGVRSISVDRIFEGADALAPNGPEHIGFDPVPLDDPAWILHRASPGIEPLGVIITRRSLSLPPFFGCVDVFRGECVALPVSCEHEVAYFEIFRALSLGVTVIATVLKAGTPSLAVANTLRKHKAVTGILSASALEKMAKEFPWALRSFRALLCSDSLPAVSQLHRHIPPSILQKSFGVYGSTESGGIMGLYSLASGSGRDVHFERLAGGVRLFVLDAEMSGVPFGIAGELCLGCDSLSPGYYRDESRSAITFSARADSSGIVRRFLRTGDIVRCRSPKNIEILGRYDGRQQIDGYRIDLEEIEGHVKRYATVQDAAVLLHHSSEHLKPKLTAFVVPKAREVLVHGDLRAFLSETMPSERVPQMIFEVAEIVRYHDGRPNSAALVQRMGNKDEGAEGVAEEPLPPRDDIEEQLVEIWRSVLGRQRIGIQDNFFVHGGRSLLAAPVMAAIRECFNIDVPLKTLFEAPTIIQLARVIKDGRKVGGFIETPRLLVELRKGSREAPFFCVHPVGGEVFAYSDLANSLTVDQAFYGITSPSPSSNDPHSPETIEEIAELYIQAIRKVQPEGPYSLGGWSFGGLVAFEMTRQLKEKGETVSLLVLVDTYPPYGDRGDATGLDDQTQADLIIAEVAERLQVPVRDIGDVWATYPPDIRQRTLLQVLKRHDVLPEDTPEDSSETGGFLQAFAKNCMAAYKYRLSPLDQQVVLFRAAQAPDPHALAAHWKLWARGGVDIVLINGNHNTMLQPPNVSVLGEKLSFYITQALQKVSSIA